MFATLPSCVLVLLVSGVAQMPKEPDFSGEWMLVEASGPASAPAPALTVRQAVTRTTRRGEPMAPWFSDLTVERQFKSGVVSESYKIGMSSGTVGGVSGERPSPQRDRTTVTVTWKGASLIIKTGMYSGPPQEPDPYTEHEEVWSFDQSGRLLITITDRSSRSQPATVMLTYRRRPSPVPIAIGAMRLVNDRCYPARRMALRRALQPDSTRTMPTSQRPARISQEKMATDPRRAHSTRSTGRGSRSDG